MSSCLELWSSGRSTRSDVRFCHETRVPFAILFPQLTRRAVAALAGLGSYGSHLVESRDRHEALQGSLRDAEAALTTLHNNSKSCDDASREHAAQLASAEREVRAAVLETLPSSSHPLRKFACSLEHFDSLVLSGPYFRHVLPRSAKLFSSSSRRCRSTICCSTRRPPHARAR